MNNQPLVCICIPNYNNENTIRKTLDSIVNQTYKNIIIKIFDNASTDGSIDILREYEKNHPNVQVFQNETNIGGEQNFNKCFDNAEGKYVAVFHSDDVYDFTIIEKQVAFLEKNVNCSAVSTSSFKIDADGNIIERTYIPNNLNNSKQLIFTFEELFKNTLRYGNFIICPSVMSRTKIIKENIKFWNYESFKTSSDLDVWFRLSKYGCFGIIEEPLISYRLSEASYSFRYFKYIVDIPDMFAVLETYLDNSVDLKKLDHEDIDNYKILYNKSTLKININRYLLDKDMGYQNYKQLNFSFKSRIIYLKIMISVFNIIKFIKFPRKIKGILMNAKLNEQKIINKLFFKGVSK